MKESSLKVLKLHHAQVSIPKGAEDRARDFYWKLLDMSEIQNLEALTARGIPVLDGIPIPGFELFEFRDPFGNRVEFLEARWLDSLIASGENIGTMSTIRNHYIWFQLE